MVLILLFQTCRAVRGTVIGYQAVYARKVLATFGVRASTAVIHSNRSINILPNLGRQGAILSRLQDMTSLIDVRISSWTWGNVASVVACDGCILAQLQETALIAGNPDMTTVRFCYVPMVPAIAGEIDPTTWSLTVAGPRPLEMAMSADLDMLVLLCAPVG